MKSQPTWSRRKFLATASGLGATIMLNPLEGWTTDQVDPRVAKIAADTIGIDAHNHIDIPLITTEVPGPNIDLAGQMKLSGLSGICMTFAVDYQQLNKPGDAYERFMNGLDSMNHQLEVNGMKRSLNLSDLRAAHEKHQPTVIQAVEGGHFLEGHLDRLGMAYDKGLRNLGLLHDSDASVPLGDVFTNPPRWGGLTAFGADTIRECGGDGQNRERTGERTNRAWGDQKSGFYYTVIDAMLKTGFTTDEIGKVGSGNFCRVFDKATAGHFG